MLAFLITLITGIAAVIIFMLSEYKDWYGIFEDSEDEK